VAALGTALFAFAPTIFFANMGRLLIGASVAVAFVSMLKLASHWFPPKKYALASGMALLMGVVGGVVAGVPLRFLVESFGWRPVMMVSARSPPCCASPPGCGYATTRPKAATPAISRACTVRMKAPRCGAA
jgi:MFS family permease